MNKVRFLKIILAIFLLLCLAPMPYGFYVLIRYIASISFVIMAYNYACENKQILCALFLSLFGLFQPFIKLSLGREVWNIIDVIVAIFLICISVKNY